jgi:hypothetical protein
MGSIYLDWLPDVLSAAGCQVHEYDTGWPTRSRSSGGYAAAPLGVSWHHTAGAAGASAQSECDYMVRYSDAKPTCNLYVARDGVVWVLAGGATNTSGKGGPLTMSRGVIGTDCANTTTVGMEMGNNGVGEAWPAVQVDAAFRASNAINARCGNQPTDVFSHQCYAPTRKTDPATAAAVQGPWSPRSCTTSGTWDCDDIRTECARRAAGIPEEDDMTDEQLYAITDRLDALTYAISGNSVTGQPGIAQQLSAIYELESAIATKVDQLIAMSS